MKYIKGLLARDCRLQERVTGLRPEKVDATPFMTKFGEMPGGYYPIAYDPRLGTTAQQHQTAKAIAICGRARICGRRRSRATTSRGSITSRVRMRLEVGVAWTHIEQVMHDLTHREVFLDINRLLKDPKLDATLRATIGAEKKEQIADVVDAIAVGTCRRTSRRGGAFVDAARRADVGAGVRVLWTAIQQTGGWFNGAERIGYCWAAKGLMKWISLNPVEMWRTVQWVRSKSVLIDNRPRTARRILSELRKDYDSAGGWFDRAVRKMTGNLLNKQAIMDMFLFHIAIMQRTADIPTWLGAYEKHMADPRDPAHTDVQHEQRARDLADQAIIDSQGSGSIKDLAAVQRGGPALKAWGMFYSYGSTTFNSAAVAWHTHDKLSAKGLVGLAGSLASIYVMPSAYTIVMGNLIGKYDDEGLWGWFKHLAVESIGAALNGYYWARELSSAAKQLLTGEAGVRGYEGPASARIFVATQRAMQQFQQGELDAAAASALNDLAGVTIKWPSNAMRNLVRTYVAVEEGRLRNPFAIAAAAAVGPPAEAR